MSPDIEIDEKPLGQVGVEYIEKLDLISLSRWCSLFMAIDEIEQFCQTNNQTCTESLLKPIPIKHYIEAKYPKILDDLKEDQIKKTTTKQSLTKNLKPVKEFISAIQTLRPVSQDSKHS